MTSKVMASAAVLAGVGAMLVATAPTASAATARNGVCEIGEICFYYNSNQQGSVSDFAATASVANYGSRQPGCYEFKGAGAGKGLCMKNRAASVWNRSYASNVTVYYNSNYAGARQTIGRGARANLNATLKNNNASHKTTSVPNPSCRPGVPCPR